VEDNESDVFLIREAIEATKLPLVLHMVQDGEQALRFFDDLNTPCPALVILDINLPKAQGGDVLKHMHQSPKCGNVLVIAISSSESARDREQMTKLGANAYFRKPSNYEDFMKLGDMIKSLLGGMRPL
jgi:chemotaxis family two-component system response regulator Rcp1